MVKIDVQTYMAPGWLAANLQQIRTRVRNRFVTSTNFNMSLFNNPCCPEFASTTLTYNEQSWLHTRYIIWQFARVAQLAGVVPISVSVDRQCAFPFTFYNFTILIHFIYLYPRPTKLEGGGVYWIHLVRPSVCPSVRLSVDDMVSGA